MRDVAIIAFSQHQVAAEPDRNEVEILMDVVADVRERAGITKDQVDFVCSGSSDYQMGVPFSFVTTLDAVGPWPPIKESHVDMDGAWALYEAWVKMQMGDVDVALVYAYGKSSPGDIRRVLTRQLDPYYLGPLWVDPDSLAGLQARALLDAGITTEAELAEVAAARHRAGLDNPHAVRSGEHTPAELLAAPFLAAPLHAHDCPPVTDGATAVVLAAGDVARSLSDHPVWIRGIDHRIEAHALGARDLTDAPSIRLAAERAGVHDAPVDLAEYHAPYSSQDVLVRHALGLDDSVTCNPSGGALVANTVMAAGLIRMGEAATRIAAGEAHRAVAHATSGHCLQQNLVCVLEGD